MPSIMRPDLIEVIVSVYGERNVDTKTFRGEHAVSSALEFGGTQGQTLSDVFVLSSSGNGRGGGIQVLVIPGTANIYRVVESLSADQWGSHVQVTREISIAGPGFVPFDWQVPSISGPASKLPQELVPVPGGGLRPH